MPQHHSELDAGDGRRTRPLAVAATVCAVVVTAILPAVTQLRSPANAADQPGPGYFPVPDPAVYSGSGFLTGIGPCAFLGGLPEDGNGLEPAPYGLAFVGDWRFGRSFGGIHAAPCEIPAPLYAIAHDAPVIVSLGGEQPIQLGTQRNDDGARLLHVWDWSQSHLSRPLSVKQPVKPAAVSPDGKWLITLEGQKIDMATGAVEPIDPPFPEGVQKVRFSPDGRTLVVWVVQSDGAASVRLLSFPTCAPRCEIPEVFGEMFAVAFTADGNEVVLMDKERFVRRWDALTGVALQTFEVPHANRVRAVAVSSDGRWVASAAEGEIFLWEAPTGKLRHRLNYEVNLHIGPSVVFSLQFSPDGERLAGGGFQSLVLWNCESGAQERMFETPMWATRIRFWDEGRGITTVSGTHGMLTETRQGVMGYPFVQHWDVETGQEAQEVAVGDLGIEVRVEIPRDSP